MRRTAENAKHEAQMCVCALCIVVHSASVDLFLLLFESVFRLRSAVLPRSECKKKNEERETERNRKDKRPKVTSGVSGERSEAICEQRTNEIETN